MTLPARGKVIMPVQVEHKDIVKQSIWASAAAGVPGFLFPIADAAAMTAIWTSMIVRMAKRSGHELDENLVLKVVGGALLGASTYVVASYGITKLVAVAFSLTPPGRILIVLLGGVNCTWDALLTYRLASAISGPLSRPGFTEQDLWDFLGPVLSNLKKLPQFRELREVIDLVT
jgi:uncharacterized protein (DUF697 family)